jgi:ACDE family multidrug resistance protein
MVSTQSEASPSLQGIATDPQVLTVLFIASTSLLSSSLVPVILPEVGREFGVSDSSVGIIMSVFYVPQILLIPVTGILSDLYGRRAIVLPSLLLFGTSGVLTFVVTSFDTLLFVRLVQGIAFAGLTPLTNILIGDIYTGAAGSVAQGLRSSVNGLASMVAPIVAGALVGVVWNLPFLLYGIAFPVAVAAWRYLPGRTAGRGSPEMDLVPRTKQYAGIVRAEFHNRMYLLLLLGGFVLFFIMQAIRVYVPLFAVNGFGATPFVAGVVFSVYGLVRVVVSPFAGKLVGAVGRKRTISAGLTIMAVGTMAIALVGSVLHLTAALVLYTIGEAIFNPTINDGVAELVEPGQRGGLMSGLNVLKQTANAVSPAVFGLVLTFGAYQGVFLAAGVVVLLYLFVLNRTWRSFSEA